MSVTGTSRYLAPELLEHLATWKPEEQSGPPEGYDAVCLVCDVDFYDAAEPCGPLCFTCSGPALRALAAELLSDRRVAEEREACARLLNESAEEHERRREQLAGSREAQDHAFLAYVLAGKATAIRARGAPPAPPRREPAPTTTAPAPIPMILTCPSCKERHVDAGEFSTKPHHTHACQSCGMVWRPAIEPTVGVRFLPGFKDAPAPSVAEPAPPRHELKTWPEPFEAVWSGAKKHEFRQADRAFAVGDVLELREWDPGEAGYARPGYTGRKILARVTYVGRGFGIPEEYVVMSIDVVERVS